MSHEIPADLADSPADRVDGRPGNGDPGNTDTCPDTCHAARPLAVRLSGTMASAITIACALVLAVDRLAPMRWLFVAWSVANTLWVYYGWRIGSFPVLSSQAVFCAIDVIGLCHYW